MPESSSASSELLRQLETLNQIGIALTAERDLPTLLQRILTYARELTRAEAGTVYIKDPHQDALRFAVLQNEVLRGEHLPDPESLPPIPLHLDDGTANRKTVAALAALDRRIVNVPDAYATDDDLDFSGTERFDTHTGYRSTSFLAVPMIGRQDEIVGVLQLINARTESGTTVPFSPSGEACVASLASQAAMALDNRFENEEARSLASQLLHLSEIGIALSAEKDIAVLLERILESSRQLTRADGGTLYLLSDDRRSLTFEILRNETLGIRLGGTTGRPVEIDPLPLYREDGSPNHGMVAVDVALAGRTVAIEDAYETEDFDFSGAKRFDARSGYRSRSFLTVPLKDHEDELLGVLQLINARTERGETIPFSDQSRSLVEALASQAAVALTNRKLYESLEELFNSFIRTIATAIDKKSPYTAGHCERVPILTMLLAEACHRESEGPLADFTMNDDQRSELRLAAWLHDCGKVATPEHVVDKSTKLETIFDRLELIETRAEVLERDAEIAELRARLTEAGLDPDLGDRHRGEVEALRQDVAFVARCNHGGEFMDPESQDRIRRIGERRWMRNGEALPFLSDNEIENLTISRGTLNEAERQIINDHVVVSIEMLEQLPFPRKLANVPEFAGAHHEKIDGSGYPRGLKRHEMSWEARMMAIADVFEALTAPDRPYRKPNTLSQAMRILGFMKKDRHIDPDLFDVFVRQKVHLEYAREHLKPEQIDDVDERELPLGPVPENT